MKQKKITWTIRIGVLFLVLLLLLGGGGVWWKDGISPVDEHDTKDVLFVVRKGEMISSIAGRLASERLIRSRTTFFLLVKYLGIDNKIQAGDFHLKRTMRAKEIAEKLTQGTLDIWVTTLEGWRVEEIANKLSQTLGTPEQEFIAVSEEGYMFPDTYRIPKTATAGAVSALFRRTFDEKVTPQMREDAKRLVISFDQVVTLASIVEREGRTNDDRPMIAGILLKRLKADWPLQADATLQYALGYQVDGKTWWKKTLTEQDKKITSPFNTYAHPGLPPRPISNPGLASIKAVIYAKDSPYWFYFHDPKGQVYYAKTIEEHNANVQKYLQ